jgi:ABC-type branched-subunit amino acid transport system substrate-binding protein
VSVRETVRIGVSLSLSGALRLQGEQALCGLRLWADRVAPDQGLHAELVVLDDASRARLARENVERLFDHDRVGALVGPYGSALVLAAAAVADSRGAVLWNHGGASDALFERGWRVDRWLTGLAIEPRDGVIASGDAPAKDDAGLLQESPEVGIEASEQQAVDPCQHRPLTAL